MTRNCGNIHDRRLARLYLWVGRCFYSESEFRNASGTQGPASIDHTGPRSEIAVIFHNFHNFHNFRNFTEIVEIVEKVVVHSKCGLKPESCLVRPSRHPILLCRVLQRRRDRPYRDGLINSTACFQKPIDFPQFPQLFEA